MRKNANMQELRRNLKLGSQESGKENDDAEGEKRIHKQGLMSRILNSIITTYVNEQIYAWVK